MSSKKDREPRSLINLESSSNGAIFRYNDRIRCKATATSVPPITFVCTGVAIRNGVDLIDAPSFYLDNYVIYEEEGTYKIHAYAYDQDGNRHESETDQDHTVHIHGGPNAPTGIKVWQPGRNSLHKVGERVNLESSASYPEQRRIVKVEYYVGETPIGETLSFAPYNSHWIPTEPGQAVIKAKMTMDDDEIIISEEVPVFIIS